MYHDFIWCACVHIRGHVDTDLGHCWYRSVSGYGSESGCRSGTRYRSELYSISSIEVARTENGQNACRRTINLNLRP